MQEKPKAVVLISGAGSNLQAIINAINVGKLDLDIQSVISNNKDAGGLLLASKNGLNSEFIDHRRYADRLDYDHALIKSIDAKQIQIVVLAGFMRILSDEFVNHYLGQLINIHPSLLPEFKGLNTHQRAIDAGCKHHGASVHFVTPTLDDGPVIVQEKLEIKPNDTAESLAQRVLNIEHQIYPLALQWLVQGRVELKDSGIYFDSKPLTTPQILSETQT